MPEFECQTYWHELPDPVVPWKHNATRLRREKQDQQATPGNAMDTTAESESDDESETRQRLRSRGSLAVDPNLNPTAALDEVLAALRCRPLAPGELRAAMEAAVAGYRADHPDRGAAPAAAGASRGAAAGSGAAASPRGGAGGGRAARSDVSARASSAGGQSTAAAGGDPRAHVDDPPLLRALRTVLGSRRLLLETAERRTTGEALSGENFFQPHKSAVFAVDREKPLFIAAYAVPPSHPKSRRSCMVRIMVPVRDPLPLRLYLLKLKGLSKNECFVLRCRRPDGDVSDSAGDDDATDGSDDASAAAGRASKRHRREERAKRRLRWVGPAPLTQPVAPGQVPHDPGLWFGIPAVESNVKTRLKRSVKHAWYHRVMGTAAVRVMRARVASNFAGLGNAGGASSSEDD